MALAGTIHTFHSTPMQMRNSFAALSALRVTRPFAARAFTSEAPVPITVARGDGIGPEIMSATLDVLKASGAKLEIEEIDIGERLYLSGHSSGIAPESWDSLRRTKVFLKAPITTPIGGGYKSECSPYATGKCPPNPP